MRRGDLGTTTSFRKWFDWVSSHAMIKGLGGLLSSNEQGGHTYFFVVFLPWSVAGLCFAGNSTWKREEAGRSECGTLIIKVAPISGRWPVVSGFRWPGPFRPTGGRERFALSLHAPIARLWDGGPVRKARARCVGRAMLSAEYSPRQELSNEPCARRKRGRGAERGHCILLH